MTQVKKHIRYSGIDLKKEHLAGLNIAWIGTDEAYVEGDSVILNAEKARLEGLGAIITILADLPLTVNIPEPQLTPEQIAESNLQQQTKQNIKQSEIDRINTLLQVEYTALGGIGTAPQINSLREII